MKSFICKKFPRAIRVVFQSILLPVVLAVSGCGGGGGSSAGGGGGVTPTPVPINFFLGDEDAAPLNPSNNGNYRTAEFTRNYALGAIGADEAYQRGYFGQNVTVAVVDSGLRSTHQEFSGRVVPGRNAITVGDSTADTDGHGTYMAGIIAAARGGSGTRLSMHGVAPQASIMPIKIFTGGEDSVDASNSDVINAINWAYNRNVKIFNNSYSEENILVGRFGNTGNYYRINVPFAYGLYDASHGVLARRTAAAVRGKDMVMVWAAGNNGWQNDTGMIRAERLTCTNLRPDGGCESDEFTSFSLTTVAETFVSESYINKDGDNVVGIGDISEKGFGLRYRGSHSSYYSSMPLWAFNNIDKFLQDVNTYIIDFDRADDPNNPPTQAERTRLERELARLQVEGERLLQDPDYLSLKLRWLAVVAVDSNNKIASYSNGCGNAREWCLAAPGSALTTDKDSDSDYDSVGGTSIAAAYVSGALAVLKSRLRSMPTYVASAVLLTTATQEGIRFGGEFGVFGRGTDNIYGHGVLNLSAAIEYQSRIRLAESPNIAPTSFNPQTSRIVLPAAMAGVKAQLSAAKVAFELPGGLYYNAPLSEFVDIQDAPEKSLGNAAADMLREETDGRIQSGMFFAAADSAGVLRHAGADFDGGEFGEWRVRHDFCDDCGGSAVWQTWQDADVPGAPAPAAPFFAGGGQDRFLLQMRGDGLRPFAAFGKSSPDGDSGYQQFGLRWSGGVGEGFSLLAEASRIDEDEHFMGADWRALGAVESRTWQGRFALRGELAAGWKSFLQVEAARGDVNIKSGGFLRGASGLRADGFLAGLERSDVLVGGDKLRLWAGQETALRAGKLHLRYPQAEGDFASAFYGVSGQTLQTSETDVELSNGASTILALGYALKLSDKSAAAFAIEKRGDESAVSGQFRFRF